MDVKKGSHQGRGLVRVLGTRLNSYGIRIRNGSMSYIRAHSGSTNKILGS